jgi:hypothetical protein
VTPITYGAAAEVEEESEGGQSPRIYLNGQIPEEGRKEQAKRGRATVKTSSLSPRVDKLLKNLELPWRASNSARSAE